MTSICIAVHTGCQSVGSRESARNTSTGQVTDCGSNISRKGSEVAANFLVG